MRRVTLALVALLIAAVAWAQTDAVVQRVSGRVEVMQPGGAWTAASPGMRLALGATVSTSFQSEATLALGSSVVQVKPLTRMRIDQLAQQQGTVSTELYLRVGRVRAEVKSTEGLRQDFKVRSPVSTAAVRGTTFENDGVNTVVEDGLVTISNQYGQGTTLGGGEQGSTTGDDTPTGGEDSKEEQANTDTSTGRGDAGTPPQQPSGPGSIRVNWKSGIVG
jgi:hypothetical protein